MMEIWGLNNPEIGDHSHKCSTVMTTGKILDINLVANAKLKEKRKKREKKESNPVLCSCFCPSVSALQSVLPVGVWRIQRCYYVTTTAAVAIFTALSSGRRDNRVARRASPRDEKSPKKAFNRLFHTLCLKYHSVGAVSVLLLLGVFFG